MESKPEQESLLLRGRRSRREPPDRRQAEEGAARRVSVTEWPHRVRSRYPQLPAVGPSLLPAAGPLSRATAPFCTSYPESSGHLGPLPAALPRSLTHRPLRRVAFFSLSSSAAWTLTHNSFRLWGGLDLLPTSPWLEGLVASEPLPRPGIPAIPAPITCSPGWGGGPPL